MRGIVVIAIVAACRGPLGPGETRCTSRNVYGTLVTDCEEGPKQVIVQQSTPPPTQQTDVEVGWWCTSRDGEGVCDRHAGMCEVIRANLNSVAREQFEACERRMEAVCATSGCFTTPSRCALGERTYKRSAAECTSVR